MRKNLHLGILKSCDRKPKDCDVKEFMKAISTL